MNQGMQTGIERSRPQLGKGGGAGKEEREGRGNVHGVIQARHFQHMSRGPVVRAVGIHQDPVIAPSFLIRPLPPSLPPCSVFCGIQDSTQGQRLSAPSSAVHSLLSPCLHALGGRRNGKNKMKKGAWEELGREDPFFPALLWIQANSTLLKHILSFKGFDRTRFRFRNLGQLPLTSLSPLPSRLVHGTPPLSP
jgi:hypothetical protein